jgi:hypothetical protein
MKVCWRLGTAALAIAALIAASPQDKAEIKLKFDRTPVKFKSVILTNMDIMGVAQSNTISIFQTVTPVETKEGWTTLRFKTDDFKMEGDGMMGMEGALDSVKEIAIRMEVDEQGRTRNVSLENADKVDAMTRQMIVGSMKSDQVAGFMGVHFPKEAIGVGSKWNVVIDAAQMFDKSEFVTAVSGKLPVSYEVTAFEDLNGKRNVKVHSTMNGTITMDIASPAGDMKATVKMVFGTDYWIDLATGILTKSAGNATIDNDFGMGTMVQKLEVKVDRVG